MKISILKKIQKINKTQKIIATVAISILFAAIMIFIMFSSASVTSKEYDDLLLSGDKYIEQFDYEKAEDSYLQAIDVDAKRIDSYEKLTDLYLRCQKYDDAIKMLEKSIDKVDSSDRDSLKNKELLVEYLQDDIVKKYDKIEQGSQEDIINKESFLNAVIKDFDHDDVDELVAIVMDNEDGNDVFKVLIYEIDGKDVKQQDQYDILNNISENGECIFFVQETSEGAYVCISVKENNEDISYILKYDNQKIQEYATSKNEDEFKNKLEELGLDINDIYFKEIDYDKIILVEIVDNHIVLIREKSSKKSEELYQDIIKGYYIYQEYNIMPSILNNITLDDHEFTSINITMSLCDINDDGSDELIVDSENGLTIWAYNGYDITMVSQGLGYNAIKKDNTIVIDETYYTLSSKAILKEAEEVDNSLENDLDIKFKDIKKFISTTKTLSGWKKLYIDYINGLDNADNLYYYTFNLNGDNIPDIFVSTEINGYTSGYILTISNNQVVSYTVKGTDLAYIEGKNTLKIEDEFVDIPYEYYDRFNIDIKVDDGNSLRTTHIDVYNLENGNMNVLYNVDYVKVSGVDDSTHYFTENKQFVDDETSQKYYRMFIEFQNGQKNGLPFKASDFKKLNYGFRYDEIKDILVYY